MSRREQQFKVLTHQINQLADVDNARHGVMAAERSAVRTLGYGSALPKLQEDNDIEQYLTTFKQLAEVYLWPKADWAVHLVPLLTGKARAVFVAMAPDTTMDYDKLKEVLL